MDYKIIGLKALGATAIVGGVMGSVYYYKTLDTELPDIPSRPEFNSKPPNFKTIRTALATKKPLNTKDGIHDTKWKNLIKKYLENEDKKIKITGLKTAQSDENDGFNLTIFKHACNTLLEKPVSSEKDKEIAENWCTEESPLLKNTKLLVLGSGGA